MKKRFWFILASVLLIIVVLGGGSVMAAGGERNAIPVINENTPVTVLSPFSYSASTTNFVPQNGYIYAGERVSSTELTIENVGRMTYGINIYPRIVNSGPAYPSFDLRIIGEKGAPINQLPILAPGAKFKCTVEVFISYSSPPAVFRGLELNILPTSAKFELV